ncbi:MAG: nucleotidyl transferase AbiEii/AbiGii toxin family protein [Myxococcales bacterium]
MAPARAMTHLEDALAAIAAALAELRVACALVGGLAVSARAEPRFTRDLDLAVAVASDAEAEALVRALGSRGYRPLSTVEQTSAARLATVRLSPSSEPGEGVVVDLLLPRRASSRRWWPRRNRSKSSRA